MNDSEQVNKLTLPPMGKSGVSLKPSLNPLPVAEDVKFSIKLLIVAWVRNGFKDLQFSLLKSLSL